MQMIDVIIIGVILFSVVMGFFRGFIKETLALLSWILALWVTIHFATDAAILGEGQIQSHTFRVIVAAIILFCLVLLLGALASKFISNAINAIGLGGVNRLLGIVFGFLRGMFIVTVFLFVARLMPMAQQSWWEESWVISRFQPFMVMLEHILPERVKQHVSSVGKSPDQPAEMLSN